MNISDVKKVTVAGCGTQGSQVASQVAVRGFDVTIWLRTEESITKAKPKLAGVKAQILAALEAMKKDRSEICKGLTDKTELTDAEIDEMIGLADQRLSGLRFETDPAKAFGEADVVVECIPETPAAKKAFYASAAPHFLDRTLILTDTSHLLPSSFAAETGHPEHFTTLHFPNQMWKYNMAEVMRTAKTDQDYFDLAADFARAIGMVPIILQKEWPGYILNSLCAPWYMSALTICANGVADPKTIDMVWQMSTGADPSQTPFRKLDKMGLGFVYNYARMDPDSAKEGTNAYKVLTLMKPYMDSGKTGVAAGEGFYKYLENGSVE